MPYVGRDLQRGNYVKLDDISSSFDGSVTTFNLTLGNSAFYPGSPFAILVSLGGIIQEPESAYTINQSQITFAAAPHNVDNCFIIALGLSLGIGVPGHGTVDGDQLAKPLNYNTGDLYLDSTNNRIGVGNTSPQYRLDVTGDANVSGNLSVGGTVTYQDVTSIDSVGIITAQAGIHLGIGATAGKFDASTGISTFSSAVGIADSIFHVGNTDTSIRFPDDDVISVETSGDEKLRITSTGQVGIGTDVPSSTNTKLQVYTNSHTIARMTGGISSSTILYFGDPDDTTRGWIAYNNSNDSMELGAGNADRIHIDSSGRVSIGQTDPSWGVSTGLIVGDGASSRGITIYSNSSNVGDLAFADATSGTGRYSGLIRYSHNNNFMAFRTATDERIRIISDGKVGIGTTAPESLLSLYSEADGAELLHFDMGSSDARRGWKFLQHDTGTSTDLHLQADSSGKWFAICNSSGTEQFEVYTSTTAADAFVRVIPRISIGSTIVHHGDQDTSIGFPADGQFAVETNGSERLRVSNTGKLLIGTDSSRQTRVSNSSFSGLVQVESDAELGFTLSRFVDTSGPPRFVIQKARGTAASPAIVQDDDTAGQFLFSAYDGSDWSNVAKINAEVDGNVGVNSMPGRMVFGITAAGSNSVTERLRINSTGQLELRKNQGGVTGRPENRIVFRDLDSSVAAEQPIGEISWYSTDAGMTNVNSWIRGINEATNGAGALLFGVKDAGEDEIEALRITHDGLVGIGTPVPDAKLEVYNGGIKIDRKNVGGTSNPHLNMVTGANGTARLMIYAEDGTDDNSNWVYKTNANEEHSFVVATTEILRLRSNKVGIGQSVPTARLQVAGSNPYAVTDSGRAVEGIDITGTAGGNGNYGAAISFGAGATGRAAITAVQNATDADNVGLAIITHPSNTGAADAEEKIRITSDGNVGIGTDNPLNPLEVWGSSVDLAIMDTQAYSQNSSGPAVAFQGNDSAGVRKTFADIRGVANGSNIGEFAIRTRRTGGTLTEALRIDSSGRVLIGTTNVPSNKNTVTPSLNVLGSGVNGAAQITRHTSVGGGGALLHLAATRGGDVNSYTILQDGDGIGTVAFNAADGNEFVVAAEVKSQVDGTPGDNDMPGRLIFATTSDGASSPTERLRIDSSGSVWIGSDTQYGNNAFNISNGGTIITSSGQNTLKLIDSTAQTADVGARILLGGNYRSSGDASPMVELKSFKENSTDNNYAYGFKISTTPNGGSLSERLRIASNGGIIVAANANDVGTIQLQDNLIGGHRIAVDQDTISDAIYMPRKGCIVAITAFTTYDTYPQPGSSGMAYLDMGPSRRVDIMYHVNEDATGSNTVGNALKGKGAYSATITDCTNNKTTLMAGNTEGTFRIVNRTSNDYTYTITFL